MKHPSVPSRACVLLSFGLIATAPASGAEQNADQGTTAGDVRDLTHLSLEELGNIIVTSVSKKGEPLGDAAASIFVITQNDIRRSGATSLPEALRLAPNLEVAQTSASGYDITARGFNGGSANKLLVLIDGRTVYTPLFSGVFWDAQDVMLEDIERIEVISGPGGTLWGVNAVNGVINIITRSARDTQGGLATSGIGNLEQDSAVRYGGTTGNDVSYRLYAKTFDRDHTVTASGSPVDDGWHRTQAGFRVDWNQPGDRVTLQGDAYHGEEGQPLPGEISIGGVNIQYGPVVITGENLTMHWEHKLEDGSQFNVISYFDRTERDVDPTYYDTLYTYDVQVAQSLAPIGMHSVTWGAEYRYGADYVVSGPHFAFLPPKLNQTWASAFAQDDMALTPSVKLTAGARLEHNDYTGNEFLPNLRLSWKTDEVGLLWTALSRTVRAPSRLDRDSYSPSTPPFQLDGGPQFISEVARVFELGYRSRAFGSLNYSATLFYSAYDHLRSAAFDQSLGAIVFANAMEGHTEGLETWGTYQATPTWRLSAGLSVLKETFKFYPGSGVQFPQIEPSADPAQWWSLRSSFDLPAQTELDISVRRVGALSAPAVPAYTAVGARLGWTPRPNLEFSITAQNLIGAGHGEFSDVTTRSQLGRSVFFKFTGRF